MATPDGAEERRKEKDEERKKKEIIKESHCGQAINKVKREREGRKLRL